MTRFDATATAEEVTEGLDLRGQTWLVTGVTSGLGRETARVLGLRGAHVIGAGRTVAAAAETLAALGVDGTPLAVDLSEPAQVRAAARSLAGRTLAGVIANAGVMALPTLQQKHGLELQLLTNHVGHFALVTSLLDALAEDGRVVVLSSAAHFGAKQGLELDNLSGERDYHPWRMYARSKLANVLFARGLARRFAGSGRTANAVHPGVIRTNLARHVADAEGLFARMKDLVKTVGQGASTQVLVATRPELAGVSGRYFSDNAEAEPLPLALDDALAEALWETTEGLLTA